MSFLHIDLTQVVEILPQVRQGLPILHNQYHGCWWPGDARSQGISNHDIYNVELDHFGPHTLTVKIGRFVKKKKKNDIKQKKNIHSLVHVLDV